MISVFFLFADACTLLKKIHLMQVAESSSALFGAFAFDGLKMGVRGVAMLMSSISAVSCCLWILYAYCQWPSRPASDPERGLEEKDVHADVEHQGLLSSQQ